MFCEVKANCPSRLFLPPNVYGRSPFYHYSSLAPGSFHLPYICTSMTPRIEAALWPAEQKLIIQRCTSKQTSVGLLEVGALTPSVIALAATSAICQLIGASLIMPLTKGLAGVAPSIGFGTVFAAGLGIMARLINSGNNLSALLPFMAAVV